MNGEDKNLFGVVNSVTRAGQTFDSQNWVRFDQIGGQLLDMSPSRWDSTVKRADSLDVKDFDKVFRDGLMSEPHKPLLIAVVVAFFVGIVSGLQELFRD